jgi:tRNA(fMet)-specific endonuclease VapC
MILLDTDHCIFFVRGHPKVVAAFAAHVADEPAVSIITLGELYFGALRSARKTENLQKVSEFINRVTTVELDRTTMLKFAEIKADLFARGQPLEDPDLLIAACALIQDAPVITHNSSHFARIPGLSIEDWSQ